MSLRWNSFAQAKAKSISPENIGAMKNRTVFITGASAGIGRAAAVRFHQAGARVVAVARRAERLKELEQQLGSERCFPLVLDITDAAATESALKELPAAFSEISVLVNNAGCAVGMEPIWEADLDDWETMLSLNIKALLRVTRWILPQMVARDQGHIINLGSVAGRYAYRGGHVYGASKAFVEQFSHNLRCDLLGKRVRVTNIEPGLVETEFSLRRFRGDQDQADSVYAGIEAMTAEDIAEAIVWSASVPERMNINRIEMMATMQASGGFAFHRE